MASCSTAATSVGLSGTEEAGVLCRTSEGFRVAEWGLRKLLEASKTGTVGIPAPKEEDVDDAAIVVIIDRATETAEEEEVDVAGAETRWEWRGRETVAAERCEAEEE